MERKVVRKLIFISDAKIRMAISANTRKINWKKFSRRKIKKKKQTKPSDIVQGKDNSFFQWEKSLNIRRNHNFLTVKKCTDGLNFGFQHFKKPNYEPYIKDNLYF